MTNSVNNSVSQGFWSLYGSVQNFGANVVSTGTSAANYVAQTVANNQTTLGSALVVLGVVGTGGGGALTAVATTQVVTTVAGLSTTAGGAALLVKEHFLSN